MSQTLPTRIRIAGDTASNLAALNPVPALNEFVRETDTGRIKIGDGVTAFNSLGLGVCPVGGPGSVQAFAVGALTAVSGLINVAADGASLTLQRAGVSNLIVSVYSSILYLQSPLKMVFGTTGVTDLQFCTNNTIQGAFNSSGNLVIGNGGIASTGAKLEVAGSISATTLAESGTWTATLIGSAGSAGAYAAAAYTCAYRKIGNLVTVMGYITLTNKGSWTGAVSISGLPFNSSGYSMSGTVYLSNVTGVTRTVSLGTLDGSGVLKAFIDTDTGNAELQWSAINNNTQIGPFQITYYV